MALREGWPEEEWAQSLDPLLTSEAQYAYYTLPLTSVEEYPRLKEEVLAKCGLSLCQAVMEFHHWTYHPDLTLCC